MVKASAPLLLALLILAGCGDKPDETKKPEEKPAKPALTKLEVKDEKVGTGPAAAVGDTLFMRYTGKLGDGTIFDASDRHENKPFTFVLGQGMVIKGWDQGMVGMKAGGKRALGIPYSLGYGEEGSGGGIPPKSDLYFDVELLELVKAGEGDVIERQTVKPGTGREAKDGDTVTVKYEGTLVGGAVFDKKYKVKPYTFKLGDKKIRNFFQIAVRGMREGGRRKVRVNPDAGFGPMGGPNVEPNQILFYDVTLVDIK